MEKNYIKLDHDADLVLLYGFKNLNPKCFVYYSPISKKIALTNNPRFSDNCYALYAKKVNKKYFVVNNPELFSITEEWDLSGKYFIWVKRTQSYIISE